MAFRIGILGGTFNPIHTGHLLVAEGILVEQKLDYVLFIPCAVPPHKRPLKLAPTRYRLEMVKAAVKGNSSFKVSTVELDRGGKSYSIDTLEELTRIYRGKAKFFFIIGSDSFYEFSIWKDPNRLLRLCTLVVVERPGCPLTPLEARTKGPASRPAGLPLMGLTKKRIKGMKIANVPTLPISSTDIRTMVRQGKSIKYLVPENVRKYILKYGLYCPNPILKGGEKTEGRQTLKGGKKPDARGLLA